jgi:hypothetical protein
MKRNVFYIVLMVNLISTYIMAQKKPDTSDLFKITGAALFNDQRVADYSVSVYLDGVKIDSMYTKSKKTIKFYVCFNKVFTFLYQKKGCADKIIIVNTEVPDGLQYIADNTFDFEVELSQSLTRISEDLEDYPIAVLLINKEDEMLQASAEYDRLTHKSIQTDQSSGILSLRK